MSEQTKAPEICTTYNGVRVTLNERTNRWEFELRGRAASRDTLAEARKAIDAPPPKDKIPFNPIEAWHFESDWVFGLPVPRKVRVTSLTENNQCWISMIDPNYRGYRERTRVGADQVYPCGPENDAVIKTIMERNTEIGNLKKEVERLRKTLATVEVKKFA